MTHFRNIAKLLAEQHLTLLLRLPIVGVSAYVHVSATVFIRDTTTIPLLLTLFRPLFQKFDSTNHEVSPRLLRTRLFAVVLHAIPRYRLGL
jgi:hypothetical protein